jgi:hypothetical protein
MMKNPWQGGCKWSLFKVREVRPRWNLEAEEACFSSLGALKTYMAGRNQVIPIQ